MPGASSVLPDDPVVVGGLLRSLMWAPSERTVASQFVSLQYLAEARGTSYRSGGIKSTLLAAYFCSAS